MAKDETLETVPPRSTMRVELDGDYRGWWADMDDRPPTWGFLEEMESGSVKQIADALASKLVAWNFTDEDGNPAPATRDGLKLIENGAIVALTQAYGSAYRALPKRRAAASSRTSAT